MPVEEMTAIINRLDRIERLLMDQKTVKDWYSTEEVAGILDRSAYTIREWCRHGRVSGQKRPCGRGTASEWIISHQELTRIQNQGLLPVARSTA
jgi:transposase